jgi:hypothetical protein
MTTPSDLATIEAQLAAAFAAPLDGGPTVAYARLDARIRELVDARPDICKVLAARVRSPKPGDTLAASFHRLNAERREGLLAFFDEARKREALRREHLSRKS